MTVISRLSAPLHSQVQPETAGPAFTQIQMVIAANTTHSPFFIIILCALVASPASPAYSNCEEKKYVDRAVFLKPGDMESHRYLKLSKVDSYEKIA